jgi:hypothetical protein
LALIVPSQYVLPLVITVIACGTVLAAVAAITNNRR